MRICFEDLKESLPADPAVRAAYDFLAPEFEKSAVPARSPPNVAPEIRGVSRRIRPQR